MTEKSTKDVAKQEKKVACASCGRRAPRETMVTREQKYYCCDNCADGKECECGED